MSNPGARRTSAHHRYVSHNPSAATSPVLVTSPVPLAPSLAAPLGGNRFWSGACRQPMKSETRACTRGQGRIQTRVRAVGAAMLDAC
jgi:hypothetical protein